MPPWSPSLLAKKIAMTQAKDVSDKTRATEDTSRNCVRENPKAIFHGNGVLISPWLNLACP